MKKKPVIIVVSIAAGIAIIYCFAWAYLKHFVWMPHLPADITEYTVEKSFARTYYRSPPDDKYYNYTISTPGLFNFPWYCSFNVISGIGTDDEHVLVSEDGSVQYIPFPMSGSDFTYSFGGHLGLNGKINLYVCSVNSYSYDDQFPKSAFFLFNHELELEETANYTEQEIALYHRTKPELENLRDNMNKLFSLQ
ncbi:MAG: hypothetical protein IKI45_08105 [Oscillospiraceae bacterium]|nr:hypothetical protein [Oscillospiraceae bacterium]